MPYSSNDDLPDAVQKLSEHAQTAFRKAFSAALDHYGGDEQNAFAVAWSAAKKADGKDDGGDDHSESREGQQPPTVVTTNRDAGDDGTSSMTPAQTERPVRESTVQSPTIRANIVREGRGYRIKDCQIMAAGPGNALHSNVYEPEAIEALVREVQRQPKAFCDHDLPSQTRERGHRSLRDLAGVYDKRTVRYDPAAQACLADLILRPTVYDEYVAPVLEAGDNLGISVDAVGHCPERPRHVKGWKRFNSADLVPAGGARGFLVREANTPAERAAEKEFSMALLDDVSATDVRESAPALFEEIGRQYAAQHQPPPAASGEQHSARLAALEAQVRESTEAAQAWQQRVYELEAEQNRVAVAKHVDATVRECGIEDDKQVSFVAQRFKGVTMGPEGTYADQASLEAAVREAAEEFKAVLPQQPKGGQIMGLGLGSGSGGKFASPQRQDKIVLDGVEMLFGPPLHSQQAPANGGQGGAP